MAGIPGYLMREVRPDTGEGEDFGGSHHRLQRKPCSGAPRSGRAATRRPKAELVDDVPGGAGQSPPEVRYSIATTREESRRCTDEVRQASVSGLSAPPARMVAGRSAAGGAGVPTRGCAELRGGRPVQVIDAQQHTCQRRPPRGHRHH